MMILDNHGVITTADSIEKAIYKHYYFEQALMLYVKTLATGQKIKEIQQKYVKKQHLNSNKYNLVSMSLSYLKE